jgi:hypothetical protein
MIARHGGCSQPKSSAVARRQRSAAAWTSGRRPGCSSNSTLAILDRLGLAGRLDRSRASVDSASVRAKRGDHVRANPVDRDKAQSKLHLVCEADGLPLPAAVTATNIEDVAMLAAMVDDIPPVRPHTAGAAAHPAGQARRRPGLFQGSQPRLPAQAWNPHSDRPAWDRVVDPPGAAPVKGRAGAVVAELLSASPGPLGLRFGALVRVCAAGVSTHLLRSALDRPAWVSVRRAWPRRSVTSSQEPASTEVTRASITRIV